MTGIPPAEVTTATVTFHPQVWRDDRAIAADEPMAAFEVPIEDATDGAGELLEDDTSRSDRLKDHSNAPTWVQEYPGPFYVTIDSLS